MTIPAQQERRAAQRFSVHIPVSIRLPESAAEESGFTEDVSARGVFLFTEKAVAEGTVLELTLIMPSEITLAESMRVRCRGKVLRVRSKPGETKFGVAMRLESYEYLPKVADAVIEGSFGRISGLHEAASVVRETPTGDAHEPVSS
ncbi:MAG TPA: PilZ domain-containing protein [Terriglobales bacterium]|jgi:hypothetical protein